MIQILLWTNWPDLTRRFNELSNQQKWREQTSPIWVCLTVLSLILLIIDPSDHQFCWKGYYIFCKNGPNMYFSHTGLITNGPHFQRQLIPSWGRYTVMSICLSSVPLPLLFLDKVAPVREIWRNSVVMYTKLLSFTLVNKIIFFIVEVKLPKCLRSLQTAWKSDPEGLYIIFFFN